MRGVCRSLLHVEHGYLADDPKNEAVQGIGHVQADDQRQQQGADAHSRVPDEGADDIHARFQIADELLEQGLDGVRQVGQVKDQQHIEQPVHQGQQRLDDPGPSSPPPQCPHRGCPGLDRDPAWPGCRLRLKQNYL